MISESSRELTWRLIHDGKEVIGLFQSDGLTTTAHNLFEGPTEQACLDEITRHNLIMPPTEAE